MLGAEMKLSEQSEFFISGSVFNQILRLLFFSLIPERNQVPAPRVSVPFYPGCAEYFTLFLNLSSFRQIRTYQLRKNMLSPMMTPFLSVYGAYRKK